MLSHYIGQPALQRPHFALSIYIVYIIIYIYSSYISRPITYNHAISAGGWDSKQQSAPLSMQCDVLLLPKRAQPLSLPVWCGTHWWRPNARKKRLGVKSCRQSRPYWLARLCTIRHAAQHRCCNMLRSAESERPLKWGGGVTRGRRPVFNQGKCPCFQPPCFSLVKNCGKFLVYTRSLKGAS